MSSNVKTVSWSFASVTITLDTYTHLFDHAAHAADIRERMGASSFGALLTAPRASDIAE